MTIENEEQAKEAIAAVAAWVRAGKKDWTMTDKHLHALVTQLIHEGEAEIDMLCCWFCGS